MKNQWKRSAGIFLLASFMVTGLIAQPRGQGHGYGQGYGHGYGHGYGQGTDRDFGPGCGIMNQRIALNLTEEQQEEMTTLKVEHHKIMKPLRNKMVELKARERTLLSEETVDMKAVNGVIDDQTELLNGIKKLQAEQKVKMKSILTDEQIMKMDQRRQFSKHRRVNRSNFHKGPHMGRPYHKTMI